MTKIVFLDFDGVLNSYADLARQKNASRTTFNPEAVARLDTIVRRSGAKVVISSSWRAIYQIERLRTLLAADGFSGEIIDCTPVALVNHTPDPNPGHTRCLEIQAWLDAQPAAPRGFVVLDDMELELLSAFHVRTDIEFGLRDEHVDLALALLGED